MTSFPHELRREGLFAWAWTLRGPVLSGQFRPPQGAQPGVYESRVMRLEYRHQPEHKAVIEFRSPRLSRGGDQITGEARLSGANRAVWLQSQGTGAEGVQMPVLAAGILRRKQVVLAPHGQPIATIALKAGRFEIDVPDEVFPRRTVGTEVPIGRARLYEAAVAMVLAARIEHLIRHRRPEGGA